ncbi:NYN domain-containing protein [Caloramator sp. ALD01]|uniref:NYN domain-containing protein n=1 Tax=Caloramator sp. ALD01 TaxID=1031288 RepID=UPI0003FCAF3C|nr:NYN domain-containing protein [Caloramator sp. ALD01]
MEFTRYMFVDGYNVINQWKVLKSIKDENLDYARDKLIDLLQEYSVVKNTHIIVVFDAHLKKGNIESRQMVGSIEVVYTKEGETADCFIERNVAKYSKKGQVYVVTSDYIEQRIVLQMGGVRITPLELWWEIESLKKDVYKKSNVSYKDKTITLADVLDDEILEKLEKMRRKR